MVLPAGAAGQQLLTLAEAIRIARDSSYAARIDRIDSTIALLEYRIGMAAVAPQVTMQASLPGYNNSITPVVQPEGDIRFTTVRQAFYQSHALAGGRASNEA
ncbi:MAG: hypothetical protein EOP49_20585 [Sphingobacteriales bacterium]|nr:MAG: hypothetical protein EOP49_20585 [Sphingobacteriales bacterium]